MENDEIIEVQGQFVEQDDRLEKETNRSDKLRKIAFDCKTKILKNDKLTGIFGNAFVLVLLPVFAWFLITWAFPQVDDYINSQEFLFWFAIGLMAVLGIVDLIFTLVNHGKLKLNTILNEDVSTATDRIKNFKKNRRVQNIVSMVLLSILLIVLCAWLCTSTILSETDSPYIITNYIILTALVGLLVIWAMSFELKKILNACDETIELLEI